MDILEDKIKLRLKKYLNLDKINISIVNTKNFINIQAENQKLDCVVNLGIVNNIRRINKFHEYVNKKLSKGGYYLSCGETLEERVKRKKIKTPLGFKNIFLIVDFIYKRVLPKLIITKAIYFAITNGHNRVISKTEIIGRLISCGFEIIEYFEYNNLFFVLSKRIKKPFYDFDASYGPLFKMKRIGYEGKIIYIYKLRTMYPFAEYLQESLYNSNLLGNDGDKIREDYRITYWGKLLRKFWIDEIPQIINLLKGDLNLVGVRALSQAKFNLYSEELKLLRIRVKPGIIPPFYADLPTNFSEFQLSEKKYIKQKFASPIITDIKYFFKAIINIILKGARSKWN